MAPYTLIASWTEPLGKEASEMHHCENQQIMLDKIIFITERELKSNNGRVVTFSIVDNTKFATPQGETTR